MSTRVLMTRSGGVRSEGKNQAADFHATEEDRRPWILVDRPATRGDTRIQLDLSEGRLVVQQVLLQDGVKSLGLLRAQVDALEVVDLDLGFVLLLQGTEHQEKVPHVYPHLHTVRVILTIVAGVGQLDRRLRRICHHDLTAQSHRNSQCNKGERSSPSALRFPFKTDQRTRGRTANSVLTSTA